MNTKVNHLICFIIPLFFAYEKLHAQFLYTGPQIGLSNMYGNNLNEKLSLQPIIGWNLGYNSGKKMDMVFEANTSISHSPLFSHSSACLNLHYHPIGAINCIRGIFLLPYISIGAGGLISKSSNISDEEKTPVLSYSLTYHVGTGIKLKVWCFYLFYPEVGVIKTNDALPFYFTLNAARLLSSSCQKARFSRDKMTTPSKIFYTHRSRKSMKCVKKF